MNPRIIKVEPLEEYKLKLHFTNNEVKIFDTNPYLNKGIFKELKNSIIFNQVKVFMGSITWLNGQDFCPDTLYEESIKIN
jgi:hypothetical protein